MKNKLTKFTKYLALIFFLFLPFERLLTIEVSGLTAKPAFAILGICVLCFIFSRPKIQLFLEEKVLLIFSFLSFLTIVWSVDRTRSLIISLIYLATFTGYLTLRRVIVGENREKAKSILINFSLVLAFFALWQYFTDQYGLTSLSFLRPQYTKQVFGFPRVQATFLEPLLFANFLFLPIFFNIEKILKAKKVAVLTAIAQILFSMVFLLTLSRGAYFGLAGAILVSLVLISFKYRPLLKKFIFATALIVIGAILGITIIFFTAPRQSFNLFIAHSTVADAKTGESTISRLETSEVAMNYFKVHPWGIGAGAFGALSEYKEQIPVSGYQTVSNFYLEILVEEGIIGFFLFVFFLLLILNHIGQGVIKSDQQSLVFVAIFVAIFIQAITFSTLYTLPIWAFLALAWPRPSKE